jgi:hypothetical protein
MFLTRVAGSLGVERASLGRTDTRAGPIVVSITSCLTHIVTIRSSSARARQVLR